MDIRKYHILYSWILLVPLLLTSCTDDIKTVFLSDDEIKPGESVMFTTYLPGKSTTRVATNKPDFDAEMAKYHVVADDYEFTVEMFEKTASDPTSLGSAVYLPIKTYTYTNEVISDSIYASDGTLKAKVGQDSLYWPGNSKEYGFKATAGTTILETDQSTPSKFLKQDKLLGYGFIPWWDTTNNKQLDDEDKVNYHTAKQWYTNNKNVGQVPEGQTADYYKKIPLYMKHQRSLITIRLKAGEGVERKNLTYDKYLDTLINTTIYSYSSTEAKPSKIHPLAKRDTVNYVQGDYGELANGVQTTSFTAIVEPHDYLTGATSDTIAQIHLSGQRFTFYASNDFKYGSDNNHMAGYNLAAGKHLVITATLGRASRKILITAYVEDWTEAVTTSVVDDYGQAGDPIQIKTRGELAAFLADATKNKAGNVAIIVPNSLNLQDTTWTKKTLNCTLNMAGATIFTNTQFLDSIGASGNLVNGTIAVGKATVSTAVAETNLGTIERINVTTKDASNNTSTAKATRAGIVNTNSGTITGCSSVLEVYGSSGFVGGIAASSVYSDANGNTMPVIDRCTVNASVDGDSGTKGGGIVGQAVGRVSNNTYEYGITILQNATNFKNIIQCKAGSDDLRDIRAYGNSWPTTAKNEISKVTAIETVAAENPNGTAESKRYTAVIDCQADLESLLDAQNSNYGQYNSPGKRIRISRDFTVKNWSLGKKNDQTSGSQDGNVFFELDGNGKTITTDGMLFTNIQNHVYDMTVKLSGDLIADTLKDGSEAIAALAYSVYGGGTDGKGKISNIKVKGGNHRIQASTVGGIVVWAYDNAIIEDCECKANIQVWTKIGTQAKTYAGGIAACAAQATFTRCTFHNTDNTLFRNTATDYKGTSENGESTLSTGIYYGGILGGTVPKGDTTPEIPSVHITDCTSWFSAATTQVQKGAIVGYAQYAEGSITVNGMASDCQGNWWNTSSRAIGTYKDDVMTLEQVIGKRNAVEPTYDSNY